MRQRTGLLAAVLAGAAICAAQGVIVNRYGAKWVHEANDPPGAESVVLREDAATGGLELLAAYPAGHVFQPHWHESNERIILLEGRLAVAHGGKEETLEPGGFAFLPAKEPQKLACVSKTRCVFYVAWDGKPRSYPDK